MTPDSDISTTRKRRTQAERRQEAEARLLEAGLKLVAKKGVSGMTLAEVGEAAGFSRGIVAHHFGSKSAFVQALVNSIQNRFYEGQKVLPTVPNKVDRLRASIKLYVNHPGEMSAAMNVMVSEAIVFGGDLKSDMRAFTDVAANYYGHLIQQAAEKGEVTPDADTEAMGLMLLSLLRGLAATQLLYGDDPRMDRMRSATLEALDRMLGIKRKNSSAEVDKPEP